MEISDIQLGKKSLRDMTVQQSCMIPDNKKMVWVFENFGHKMIKVDVTCSNSCEDNLSPGSDEEDQTIENKVVFDLPDQNHLEYHYFYETYHHEHARANRPLRKSYWLWKDKTQKTLRWRGRWSGSKFSKLQKVVPKKLIECLKIIVKYLYFPLRHKGKFAIDNRWMTEILRFSSTTDK
jgi:hypothetical protein